MGGLPTNRTVNGFVASPENPKVMYVATRDGLFKSTNGGETWKVFGNELRSLAAVTINPRKPDELYTVTSEGVIFRSADGGSTWVLQKK